MFATLKRSGFFYKLEDFYKNLKTCLKDATILKQSVETLDELMTNFPHFGFGYRIQLQTNFLKTLSYLKILLDQENLKKLNPAALLIACKAHDVQDLCTAVLLKIFEEENQTENIKKTC